MAIVLETITTRMAFLRSPSGQIHALESVVHQGSGLYAVTTVPINSPEAGNWQLVSASGVHDRVTDDQGVQALPSQIILTQPIITPVITPPALFLTSLDPANITFAGPQTVSLTVAYQENTNAIATDSYRVENVEIIAPDNSARVANRFTEIETNRIRYEFDIDFSIADVGEWSFRGSTTHPIRDIEGTALTNDLIIRSTTFSVTIQPPTPVLNEEWESSGGGIEAYDVGTNLRLVASEYDIAFLTSPSFGGDGFNQKRFRISWEVASVDGADCWLYLFDQGQSDFDFVKEDGSAVYEALTPNGPQSIIYSEFVQEGYSGVAPGQVRIMIECDDATQIDFVGGFTIEEI